MTPRIEIINEKKLVGNRLAMSFADYKIGELWRIWLKHRPQAILNQVNINFLYYYLLIIDIKIINY
ncbi:MAG: hypothetical protein ACOYMA_11195 [Bacteroidia bacterium]